MILDHYRHPRNQEPVQNPTKSVTANNPLCGDTITLAIREVNGVVEEIWFNARGCAISVASASMLSDYGKGKSKDELQKLDKNFIIEMLGIELSPNRLKCALLSLEALSQVIS